MFFQNTSFKPSFPKLKIFKQPPLKFSNTKYVLQKKKKKKLKLISNLVGQTERHTQ